MKCKRPSDGRALDHVSLQALRLQAIKAIKSGQGVTQVAAAFGVNVRTVFRWLATYASGGQQALQAKPIPGRPPKLQEGHLRWLVGMVRETTPLQHRFEFALWTLGLIQELLQRQFALRLARSTVGRAMHALGFTPQRPLRRARERDPVLVERWQAEALPAIAAEAKRVGAVIFFGDEAGMRSDHHAGTTWSPLGRTPTVATTGRRFGTHMLCANASVFLVLDGHSIHTAKRVQEFVAAQGGRLKLFFLPAYSPHLNPDEQVWGHVKARVAKRTVTDKPDLIAKLTAALERLRQLPHLIAGFFRHPHCAYILRALASA